MVGDGMTKKVLVGSYDKDGKCRTFGWFDLSEDGTTIKLGKGEGRRPNPIIDNDSFVELPYRSLPFFWVQRWRRLYLVPNGATACVNFRNNTVPPYDVEAIKQAARQEIINNWGRSKQETPIISYITLGMVLIILLKILGVIV